MSTNGNNITNQTSAAVEAIFQIKTPPAKAGKLYPDVPEVLKVLDNWVCWKYVVRDGKSTKVPFDAKTGRPAQANNSATWTTFEQACEAADPLSGNNYDGIGFELSGTDIGGIDFDNAINVDEIIDPYALAILKLLGNAYTEKSPSGKGLHTFVKCDALPKGKRKLSKGHDGVEIYHGKEPGRYFTITGEQVLGDQIPKIDDISLPYLLITQNKDKKFKSLWLGDTSAFEGDDSSADFALMRCLAMLTHGDPAKMEKFFSASALGQREKWTDREDYRQRTIKAAIEMNASPTNIQSASKELEFHLPAVTTGTNYDFVIDPAPGQSDGWFPLGSPSLIGGASGSNKSTWMMQLLLAQMNREPFLSHSTCGRPYIVLMADRGEASHNRTMRRMRMEHENVPIKFLSVQMGLGALQEIVDKIEETNPLPQIVFIEGCDMLVEDANKKQIVGPFMSALQKIATHFHLAIVGSVGAPKCKAGEGYVAKRDNISGTEAWSRLSETVVLLQYPKGKDTASERELTVLPRNAPSESFALVMKHGRLELQTEEDRRRAEGGDREIEWVQAQDRLAKDDPTKRWWTALDMRQALELPKTTAYDWIQNASDKGHIIEKPGKRGRGKKALYRWNDSRTNPLWCEKGDQNEMDF